MLTDKSKEDRLRRWTLKRFLVIFGQNLICESILVLVLLWLLINSFKETSKEKRPIDFFYYFIIIMPLLVLNAVTTCKIGWILF